MSRATLVLGLCGIGCAGPGVRDGDTDGERAVDSEVVDTDVAPCPSPPPAPLAGLDAVGVVGRPLGTSDGGVVVPVRGDDGVTLVGWRPGEDGWSSTAWPLADAVHLRDLWLVERAGAVEVWVTYALRSQVRFVGPLVEQPDHVFAPEPVFEADAASDADAAVVAARDDGTEAVVVVGCDGCDGTTSIRAFTRHGTGAWTEDDLPGLAVPDLDALTFAGDGTLDLVTVAASSAVSLRPGATRWEASDWVSFDDVVGEVGRDAVPTSRGGRPGVLVAWAGDGDGDRIAFATFVDAESGLFADTTTLLRDPDAERVRARAAVDARGRGAILVSRQARGDLDRGALWAAPVVDGVPGPGAPLDLVRYVRTDEPLAFAQACGTPWALLPTTVGADDPVRGGDWALVRLDGR